MKLRIASLALILGATCSLLHSASAQDHGPAPSPSPTPAATPSVPAPPPVAPPSSPDPAPAAIGGLAGMNAFTTCGYLGELADDLQRGREPLEVESRAAALARGLIVNSRQIEAVAARGSGSPQIDAELAALRRLFGALGEQARALELYAVTGEETIAATYRELRLRTWEETSRLLGLSKEAAAGLEPGGASLGVKPSATPTPTPNKQ